MACRFFCCGSSAPKLIFEKPKRLFRVHYRFRRKYSILRIMSIMLTKSEINADKYYICKSKIMIIYQNNAIFRARVIHKSTLLINY